MGSYKSLAEIILARGSNNVPEKEILKFAKYKKGKSKTDYFLTFIKARERENELREIEQIAENLQEIFHINNSSFRRIYGR